MSYQNLKTVTSQEYNRIKTHPTRIEERCIRVLRTRVEVASAQTARLFQLGGYYARAFKRELKFEKGTVHRGGEWKRRCLHSSYAPVRQVGATCGIGGACGAHWAAGRDWPAPASPAARAPAGRDVTATMTARRQPETAAAALNWFHTTFRYNLRIQPSKLGGKRSLQ